MDAVSVRRCSVEDGGEGVDLNKSADASTCGGI
jgi:hypothetical protein